MNNVRIIRSRAPLRIDLLGGGSDTTPFIHEHVGRVLNAAISRYASCLLEMGGGLQGIELVSADTGRIVRAADLDELKYDGELDLLKAALITSGLKCPLRITTEIDAPSASGLGSSSALCVAVLAACLHAQGHPLEPPRLMQLAIDAERVQLKLSGGLQDQCAAAWGNIRCYSFHQAAMEVMPLTLEPDLLNELDARLLLIYTGESHVSANIHDDIRAAIQKPGSPTLEAMLALADLAEAGRNCLQAGRLDEFSTLLNENWVQHQALHPSCCNERLLQIHALGRELGAAGSKTCGAGGGGCVVFMCADGLRSRLQHAFRGIGCEAIPFVFDVHGASAWDVRGSV